jgi:hypothetical protein
VVYAWRARVRRWALYVCVGGFLAWLLYELLGAPLVGFIASLIS